MADRLLQSGYRNIMLFTQGWTVWEKSGHPVVRGTGTIATIPKPSIPLFNFVRDLLMLALGILAVVFRKNRISAIFCQLLLGIVFMVSGSTKIFEADKLAIIIDSYKIMPREYISLAAVCMPWVEVLGGLCLVSAVIPATGALLIVGMNLFFIPALTYRAISLAHRLGTSVFSVNFDCGCGLGENFAWVLILRDIGFLLMGIVAITNLVKRPKQPSPKPY
jgi:uncharacterized membrane protein YphA (DoxX/SURF4 family)